MYSITELEYFVFGVNFKLIIATPKFLNHLNWLKFVLRFSRNKVGICQIFSLKKEHTLKQLELYDSR